MSQECKWLHNQLESIPVVRYPFNVNQLPQNGIYFFYEIGESSNHGNGNMPRIVRIGTHKDGNFRTRISEHFLLNERKMQFSGINSKPSDRSIFRKNIGRAILSKESDQDYLKIWEVDFTINKNRNEKGMLRNIEREREIESRITKILRDNFQFRFISFEGEGKRMGKSGIESKLIGTVASCNLCKPSKDWMGRNSPKPQISNGKLWLSNHLTSRGLREEDIRTPFQKQFKVLYNICRQTKNH